MIKLATGVLPDDTAWSEAQGKIEIAESIYLCKEKLIESIYSEAIKCGCIAEKFDDISYLKEDVEKIEVIENRPEVQLRMKKPEYSYRLMLGSAYYGTVAAERMAVKDWKKDLIYQFYECYICKKCYFEEDGKILKSWMNGMLDRQFLGENMLDILLRHYEMKYTASVIVSILLYLYIEVLFLIMTQSGMYRSIHYKEIKKNICFGDKITDEEFLTVYNIVFKNSDFLSDFCEHLYFRVGENIIIAKWMFDEDYNVFEESRNIALNAKGSKILGEEVDFFGKNVFENVVKSITNECGWEVLQSGLKVKKTDFDLVAYKDGKVILGQIKVAHCNRKPFQLWKAECIIRKAIEQINACRVAITEDDYLLFSNLKREKIVSKKIQIKEIFYVIITGNSYFSKLGEVPVISIEDLKNILMIEKENALRFREVLKNPFNMYDIPQKPQYRWSLIEQEEYSILYNEFEI
ncbi:hypothetical protein [Lacrimispora celerecrescens]|uniref:Uncharacterized protein n=1 Tax=[Clostridium] celerecrescens 18A TaxID=1286362 RepID=A0A2M8Z9L0_9FIRM|nr:hypothetical protein [Lacrimispora celerecrescens]PJJ30124.1 hypothetical protein H171_3698 [[Clostridium] celerecrescens 18A]